jgi:5-methylcytosine-specific restriction endonuclease McrA
MAEEANITFIECSKCGVRKPHILDYFRAYGGENRRLRLRCRVCEGKREGPGIALGRRLTLTPEEKREREKAQSRASWHRHREKRLAEKREDRRANPEKYKRYDAKSAATTKAAGSDYQKRRYARLDKEAKRKALRDWRRKNPDKVLEMGRRSYVKNPKRHVARALRWAKNNPEAMSAARDRRRAMELQAEGVYTKEDVRRLLQQNGRVCFYCSTTLAKFHIDHFIPLSRGGSNGPDNLRLSCPSCNYSKGAKMPWDWMPDRFSCEAAE